MPSFKELPAPASCAMPKLSQWSAWGSCCSKVGGKCGVKCGCADGDCWQGRMYVCVLFAYYQSFNLCTVLDKTPRLGMLYKPRCSSNYFNSEPMG